MSLMYPSYLPVVRDQDWNSFYSCSFLLTLCLRHLLQNIATMQYLYKVLKLQKMRHNNTVSHCIFNHFSRSFEKCNYSSGNIGFYELSSFMHFFLIPLECLFMLLASVLMSFHHKSFIKILVKKSVMKWKCMPN